MDQNNHLEPHVALRIATCDVVGNLGCSRGCSRGNWANIFLKIEQTFQIFNHGYPNHSSQYMVDSQHFIFRNSTRVYPCNWSQLLLDSNSYPGFTNITILDSQRFSLLSKDQYDMSFWNWIWFWHLDWPIGLSFQWTGAASCHGPSWRVFGTHPERPLVSYV